MKRLLLPLMLLASTAFAQDAAQPAKKKKVIRLDAITVEGRIQKPQAFYILQRSTLNFDELNRAFNKAPWSGYSPKVHLVTPDNVGKDGGPKNLFDPDNGYRAQYKTIWGK